MNQLEQGLHSVVPHEILHEARLLQGAGGEGVISIRSESSSDAFLPKRFKQTGMVDLQVALQVDRLLDLDESSQWMMRSRLLGREGMTPTVIDHLVAPSKKYPGLFYLAEWAVDEKRLMQIGRHDCILYMDPANFGDEQKVMDVLNQNSESN